MGLVVVSEVKRMKKTRIFLVFFLLLFSLQLAHAQGVGVGISTYSINISGSILDYYVATVKVTNPSPYDINVKVFFDCFNCQRDIKIFDKKVGEVKADYRSFFTIDKTDVTVGPMDKDGVPVKIIFSPKFILKNYLTIYTPEFINFFVKIFNKKYDSKFTVPYFTLFIGERHFSGLLVADVYASSFGKMGVTPSVGSSLEVHAKGMPLASFLLLCLLLLLLVFFVLKKMKVNFKKAKKSKD
jgi:hypothetical protein